MTKKQLQEVMKHHESTMNFLFNAARNSGTTRTVDLESMQVDGLNAEEGYKVCEGLKYGQELKFTNIPYGYDNEGEACNPF